VPRNDSRARALTLGVSRGVVTRHLDSLSVLCHALADFGGESCKRDDRTGAGLLSCFPRLSGEVRTLQAH